MLFRCGRECYNQDHVDMMTTMKAIILLTLTTQDTIHTRLTMMRYTDTYDADGEASEGYGDDSHDLNE